MNNDTNIQGGLYADHGNSADSARSSRHGVDVEGRRLQRKASPPIVEKIIWQSKVFPELKMTDLMLVHLKTNPKTKIVSRWDGMMTDLEAYLIGRPEKRPMKNWTRFVLNCAKRRGDDVRSGKRFPDGRINLKASKAPEPRKEKSFAKQVIVGEQAELRALLAKLQRGTKEYTDTLAELKKKKEAAPMSFGEIMKKLSSP